MKRIFILLLMLFSTLICLGQTIYTLKTIRDKFDDVESCEDKKTLVSFDFDNSKVIIEEKGKLPITFIILNFIESNSLGSEDNIVQLVGNVYGYQYSWLIIREEDWNNLSESYLNGLNESEVQDYLKNSSLMLVKRYVVTKHAHSAESEHLWIQKLSGERLIYSKQY